MAIGVEQGYGNVYISGLALPDGKDKPLPLVAVKIKSRIMKNTILRKPEIRKRDRIVSARITDIEYQALQKRRKDAGVSMSIYVRSALLSAKVVQRISRADAEVLRKLAGEANNINQLARRANAGGFSKVASELMLLKRQIVQIINRLSDDWKNN